MYGMWDVPSTYSLGGSQGIGIGDEVEGREVKGGAGMRMMVLNWTWGGDVDWPGSWAFGCGKTVSVSETLSTDSGWIPGKGTMSGQGN